MPKILVADDNKEMLETLEQIFVFHQFEVEKAENGQEAVELAREVQPDLILLDGLMPVMDGFEACSKLKSNHLTKDIPIVFLSANYTESQYKVKALDLGADDYMIKPFNSKELVARTVTIIKRNERLKGLKQKNEELALNNKKIAGFLNRLQKESDQFDKSEYIDRLTGLNTHEFFLKRMKEELARSIRHQMPFAIIILKINEINDLAINLGHQVSGYILMKVANNLLIRTRASDVLAHDYDDLFYVLLPHTDRNGSLNKQERLRASVLNLDLEQDEILKSKVMSSQNKNILQSLSLSIGVMAIDETNNKL
ncbi:MAG: response regulator [Caldithrix sp.]|nr:response regulator [Caldithrix sp.]